MIIIDQKYKANVFGVSGQIYLEGDERGLTARYLPDTKLGRRLTSNAGEIRAVLSNYIRQEFGLPRGETGATVIRYVATCETFALHDELKEDANDRRVRSCSRQNSD